MELIQSIKNKRGILEQYSLTVYPLDIVVVIGDMQEEVNEYYVPTEAEYALIGKPEGGASASTYVVRGKERGELCVLIWFLTADDCRNSVLCHEAGHATFELFRYVGAKLSFEDQEPFCYLLGTIARFITVTLYKLPTTSKKQTTS